MTYSVRTTVSAPIEMYDALHREVIRLSEGDIDGLLMHIGLPSGPGFEVIEIWESKDAADRCTRDLIEPAMVALSQGQPGPAPEMTVDEFDVRGLITSGRHVS